MNTTKIFANEDSIVDLSSLGSKSEVKIVISGPDMNVITPQGTTVIINGALYSSIKGNKLSVKFNDGTVSGSKLVSHIDLQNIKLDRIDSTLVESSENSYKKNNDAKNKAEVEKEKEKLQQKIEEAKKAEDAADKAKNEANKAITEMVEVQNASKEIENMLSNFLGDIASKDSMAQSSDNQEIETPDIKNIPQEDDSQILIKPININTGKGRSNSSSKSDYTSDEPIPPTNISVSLKLANSSNSGSKNDTLTKVGMPKFIGTTEPNTAIVIKLDEISIDRLVSDSLGNFEFTSPIELDEGNHVFSVDATDESGATGTAKLAITVDKTTILPTFELSADDQAAAGNNLTAKLAPTIKGIAEKEAVVEVYVGSKLLATVSVNNGGEWEYKFKKGELTEGNNNIRLIAIDLADNRAINTGVIEVDSIPPEKPTITLESDSNSGLKNDNITQVKKPTFLGQSEPDAKISLYLGSKYLKDVIADKNGNWSFTLLSELTDDKYTLRAIATDLAGNKSEENSLYFEIDTVISKFSVAIIDKDDSGITKDNITNVLNPRLTGITEPDSTIEVTNNSTGEIINISSNKNGEWVFAFLNDSVEGNNNITFKVTDKTDNSAEFTFNYYVDTVPPAVPTAALNNFVALPNSLVITKEELPIFVGTAEPGSTVIIMLAGRADSSVKVSSSGQWEYISTDKFLDGNYKIDFLAMDAAGNKSDKLNYSFTIQTDTAIPTAELDQADDSGVKGDWITSHQSGLTLTGTAQQYATVKVYIGEKLIGTSVADGAGIWGLDISQNFSDDKYNIKVVATDKLSFTSTQEYQLIIDSFISQPSIKLHDSSDTGIKSDDITKVTTPSFTGLAEANSKVSLFVNGKLEGETVVGSDGVWNISTKSVLGDGSHYAVVESKDAADNTNKSIEYKFEVISSTTTPTIKLFNDTGLDTNDSITKENKPILTGTSAAYARVNILLGKDSIGNVLANEKGEWEYKFTDSQKLDDGKYALSAWVEDVAGNIAHSAKIPIEVDTNISIPSIELSSVTDSSTTGDKLTSFSKPILLIKNTDSDVREVQIWDKLSNTKVGLASYSPKGGWSYQFIDVLADGQHQFYAKAEDIAGNWADSQPFTLDIDTTLTEPTIALAAGEDTGSSKTDGITKNSRPKFVLSNIDPDVNEVLIEVTYEGIKFKSFALIKSNDQWDFTLPADWDDGKYQLIVRVTDKAGNHNKSVPLMVEVDTELSQPIIALADTQDTGSDPQDKKTNIAKPGFVINTDDDVVTLQVSIDGGNWVNATELSAGIWSYTPPEALSHGEYKLVARAIDNAGNETDSQPFALNIDTEISQPIIALAAGEDTGSSDSDVLTKNERPKFDLSNIDSDVTEVVVEVTRKGHKPEPFTLKKSNGKWDFTLLTDWEHGEYQLIVSVTDKAGNHNKSAPLKVLVDTELNVPIIALAVGEDTSSSKTDGITKNKRPKFDLSNIDSDVNEVLVEVTHDGKKLKPFTLNKSNDQWDFTLPADWADGNYQLIVSVTDKAGNHKKSAPLVVQIDTELSEPIIELADKQDTGSDQQDKKTNFAKPEFVINADKDVVTLKVSIDGRKWVDATKVDTGVWSYTPSDPLLHGEYQLVARAVDKAGNQTDSQPFTLNIDTEISQPIIAFAAGEDTGSAYEPGLTRKSSPKFDLSNIDSDVDVVKVYVKNMTSGKIDIVDAIRDSISGSWHFSQSEKWEDGNYQLSVVVKDNAGNENQSSMLDVKLDTALAKPIIEFAKGVDTGSSSSDGLTNKKQPTFDFNNIDDDVIEVNVDVVTGGTTKTVSANKNSQSGKWSFTPDFVWEDGKYLLTARAKDKAGNENSSETLSMEIDTDFEINSITLSNATGVEGSDNLTRFPKPEFLFDVPKDTDKVEVSLDGAEWIEINPDNNKWVMNNLAPLKDGNHTLKVRAIDKAGNSAEKELKFEIDTTLAVPTIELGAEQDTGIDKNDGITKISTPKFAIGNTDSDVVEATVTIGGVKYPATESNGKWFFEPPTALAAGSYVITVEVTDRAGNTKTSNEFKLEVDLSTQVNDIKLVNDNGKFTDDYIISNKTPQFEIDVPDDVKVVEVSLTGKDTDWTKLTKNHQGEWSFSPPEELADGIYNLNVKVTDIAGNETTKYQEFKVDTKLNIPTVKLSSASDTGVDNSDNLTKNNKPEFIIGNIDSDYDKVSISIDGTSYPATKGLAGWSFTPPTALNDGAHNIRVTVTDIAGNSEVSSTLIVTIDTQTEIKGIKLVEDSGINDHDGLTNNPRPSFEVIVPKDMAEVQVSVDGTNWSKATKKGEDTWVFQTSSDLQDGKYTLQVKAEDRAGNPAIKSLDFIIDTDVDGLKIEMPDDTGKKAGSHITNVTMPRFNISAKEPLETVEVEMGGVKTALVKDAGGAWFFTPSSVLSDGTYDLKVIATDKAGNSSKPEMLTFEIDTTLPSPVIDLMESDDSGTNKTDNITNVKQPKFIINKAPDDIDTVTITINNIAYKPLLQSDGSYHFTPPRELSDGDYNAVATFTDKAGNTESTTLSFTIDTSTHLTAMMDTASDTGASTSDNITKNPQPQFKITADIGSEIKVKIINNANGGEVQNKTMTISAGGSWDMMPDKLDDGKYTFKVTATDTTGNIDTQDIVFTIDTKTINPTIALADHAPDDNAEALSFFPEFKGTAEALSSVSLLINGVVMNSITADASGAWSWKPKTAMAMKEHTVSVIATDIAGNKSKQTDFTVKIPYLKIDDPTIKLDEASDSGVKGDFITQHQLPMITGVTLPGTEVVIYLNNKTIGSIISDPSGYYSYTFPQQPEGDYSLKVGIDDPRDNKKLFSPEVKLVIDTHVEDISWSVESEQKGGYINTSSPVVSGISEPGSKVIILVNGKEHAETTASATGTWQRLLSNLGADGEYTISIQVQDVAGNKKTFTSKKLTVDTRNDILSVTLKATDDSGITDNDNITNKRDVTLEGQAEPGATLTISRAGTIIKTLTVNSSGNWSSDVKLSEGNNKFTVNSVDKAGNSLTKEISITLDTVIDISDITLQDNSNTGDKLDLVTKEKSPVLQAMTDPYASVDVIINGKSHGSVKADSSGLATFTLPAGSSDGEYQVQFIATDIAGNKKESNVATVIIDSDISQFAVDDIPEIVSQTSLPVSGKGEPGAKIEIFVDGALFTSVTVDKDGTWQTLVELKTDGDHHIKVKISDAADNSQERDDLKVKLDSEMSPPTIQLDPDSNSSSRDDFLTNVKKPKLTGTAKPGSVVTLFAKISLDKNPSLKNDLDLQGKVSLTEVVLTKVEADDQGNWSYQYDQDLHDLVYDLHVTAKDLAGNEKSSEEIALAIDSTTYIERPYMQYGKYQGIDSDLTYALRGTPGFYLKGESGQEVEVFVDGQSVGKTVATPDSKTYTLPVAVKDGRHTIYYVITDRAGNTATSKEYAFMVDTSNTTPVTMDTINGITLDSITQQYGEKYIRELISDMIFSGKAEADSRIDITVNGSAVPKNWTDSSGVSHDETWTDKNGAWSRPIDLTNYKDGEITIEITSTDRAGNTNKSQYNLIIDTAISTFTSFLKDNQTPDETRWSSSEEITVIHGTGEVGAQVSLKFDNKIIKSVTVGADGRWEISTDALPAGESNIILSIKDLAGHSKDVSQTILIERTPLEAVHINEFEVTTKGKVILEGTAIGAGWIYAYNIDGKLLDWKQVSSDNGGTWNLTIASPPGGKIIIKSKSKLGHFSEKVELDILKQQGVITLDKDSDKGDLNDNMTSSTKPTLIINITNTDVVSVVINIEGKRFNANKIENGKWAYTPDSALSHGEHKITATLKDSNNVVTITSYDFIIDTELTQPIIQLEAGQNPVTNGNDNLIRKSQPGFIIRDIDDDVSKVMVSVSRDGTFLSNERIEKDTNGDWCFTAAEEWQSGRYQLVVNIEDKAGNTQASELLSVVIVPVASITHIELIDNASKDSTENLTKNEFPQFSIKVSDYVTQVRVKMDNGTEWVDAIHDATTGIWHYSSSTKLSHGQHQLTVEAIDKMGGQVDKPLEFDIDSELTQPIIQLEAGQNFVTNGNDNLIRKSQPRFIIRDIDDDVSKVMVSISRDGTFLSNERIEKDTNGYWRFTAAEEWHSGNYQLSVQVTDNAGNTKISDSLSVVIVPEVSITHIELINNTGNDSTSNLTKDQLPQFNITVSGDVNEVLVKMENETEWVNATPGTATGIWHYISSTELSLGEHRLMVKVTDKMNVQVDKQLEFNIDTELTPPTIELNPGEDNGSDTTGDITDKAQPETQIKPEETAEGSGNSLVVEKSAESQFAELDFKPLSHESQEDEYRITLLESSENGRVTQLQKPEFEILVPKDVTSVTAKLDDREYELTVVGQKAMLQADMPSEDGKYTLEVKFIDKDASFIIKDKEFTIDNSSDEIIKSMAGSGKTAKETGASGLTSDQHGHDISEIFTNSSANYIAPIDEVNDYY